MDSLPRSAVQGEVFYERYVVTDFFRGSGYGGDGFGDGHGYGSGFGDGYGGDGFGDGHGYGYGSGDGEGYGDGSWEDPNMPEEEQ